MKKLLMVSFLTVATAGGVSAFAYGINNFTVYDAKDKIVHKNILIPAYTTVKALFYYFLQEKKL